jgi:hypothetical protein
MLVLVLVLVLLLLSQGVVWVWGGGAGDVIVAVVIGVVGIEVHLLSLGHVLVLNEGLPTGQAALGRVFVVIWVFLVTVDALVRQTLNVLLARYPWVLTICAVRVVGGLLLGVVFLVT